MKRVKLLVALGIALLMLGFLYLQTASKKEVVQAGAAIVDVTVPELSDLASSGKAIFDQNCATCHGQNAAGVDGAGPPLVHVIYEPGHHSDPAFYLAVERGVHSHHWPFGNMSPVEGVDRADTSLIVTYIRELQRANGIN